MKFHIPYQMEEIRKQIKRLNGSWYHPNEKLWSIINTVEHKKQLLKIIDGKWEMQEPQRQEKVLSKYIELSEPSKKALQGLHEKIVLKGYSQSTLKTYKSFFIKFLTYFNQLLLLYYYN